MLVRVQFTCTFATAIFLKPVGVAVKNRFIISCALMMLCGFWWLYSRVDHVYVSDDCL